MGTKTFKSNLGLGILDMDTATNPAAMLMRGRPWLKEMLGIVAFFFGASTLLRLG